MDTIINGFIKQGVQFRPPTPPSSSFGGNSLNFKTNFSPKFVIPPLLWDMEDMYGTTKRPCRYLGVVGTIELNDFIHEFDSWCDMQQMRNP
jgi:hypothetical protein